MRFGAYCRRCLTFCLPPTATASAYSHDAAKYRDGDLGRSPRANVQADGALDPRDDSLGHTLRAQGFEVMAGVAAATDQPDEPRIVEYKSLEGLHEIGCVVVGVHRVNLGTQRRAEVVKRADGLGPVGA